VAALGDFFALSFVAVSPGTAAPGSGRPDSRQPDSRQPDSRQPDSAQPDSRQPDGRQAARWQPADVAYQRGMTDLAAQMGRMLGTREHRVAVSTLQLGYAARLWSPVLACALAHGIVPDLGGLEVCTELPLRLRFARPDVPGWLCPDSAPYSPGSADSPASPGSFDSADSPGSRGSADSPGSFDSADLLYRVVMTGHLVPLAAGLRGRIAGGLLWGNAASAMIGSLTVIAAARPMLARPARSIADRLLATGLLRGAGQITGPGLDFRRNSCCLYYRVPGGSLCGDCSLRDSEH
jgi:FhuF 2Fe-2S C-terminal domain